MKGMYRYRGFSIEKFPSVDQKWTVSAHYDSILNWTEYDTLDQAKNAIDELLGGQATDKAPLPERWKKSEKLKKYWEN